MNEPSWVSRKPSDNALCYVASVLVASNAYLFWVFADADRRNLFVWLMLIPGGVALIFRLATEPPREALRPFLARPWSSLPFAVAFPLLFIGACALIGWTVGLATIDAARLGRLVPHVSLAGMAIDAVLMAGEEYGWRGYLLARIAQSKGRATATLLVGLAWAIWHAPVVFMLNAHLPTTQRLALTLIQMAVVTAISFPFARAYFNGGSVVPPMVMHWLWNQYNTAVLGNIYRSRPGIMGGNLWVINGEGLLGLALAVPVAWFLAKEMRRTKSVPALIQADSPTGGGNEAA